MRGLRHSDKSAICNLKSEIRVLVRSALAEDIGRGDITSALTVPEDARSRAVISAREEGVIAGIEVARTVLELVGGFSEPDWSSSEKSGSENPPTRVRFENRVEDGGRVSAGQELAVVEGPSRSLLAGERVALNFLQHLSGIATMTARFVSLVAGTRAKIVDTRKTIPGVRALQKYAVRVGGGTNHRFGLYDGILIKDNHIAAAGGVRDAVEAALRPSTSSGWAQDGAPQGLAVEVEVTTLDELREALDAGADAVLLDNMDLETLRRAVQIAGGKVLLEASGGVNEQTVAAIAATGVDWISVGALTHSASALDIAMDVMRDT